MSIQFFLSENFDNLWNLNFLSNILPKREERTGGCRKSHNEELHNFFYLANNIRTIKPQRMRWEGHVTHMGGIRNGCKIVVWKPEGQKHIEDLDVNVGVILRWILKRMRARGLDSFDSRWGQWTGFCEHDNEARNLSIWMNILFKHSAPWSHLLSWLLVEAGSFIEFSGRVM